MLQSQGVSNDFALILDLELKPNQFKVVVILTPALNLRKSRRLEWEVEDLLIVGDKKMPF